MSSVETFLRRVPLASDSHVVLTTPWRLGSILGSCQNQFYNIPLKLKDIFVLCNTTVVLIKYFEVETQLPCSTMAVSEYLFGPSLKILKLILKAQTKRLFLNLTGIFECTRVLIIPSNFKSSCACTNQSQNCDSILFLLW